MDIVLYVHVSTWYLHVSFNLGSLVSKRLTALQMGCVLKQGSNHVLTLSSFTHISFPCSDTTAKKKEEGKMEVDIEMHYLECSFFCVQFFTSMTVKVHRGDNKLNKRHQF